VSKYHTRLAFGVRGFFTNRHGMWIALDRGKAVATDGARESKGGAANLRAKSVVEPIAVVSPSAFLFPINPETKTVASGRVLSFTYVRARALANLSTAWFAIPFAGVVSKLLYHRVLHRALLRQQTEGVPRRRESRNERALESRSQHRPVRLESTRAHEPGRDRGKACEAQRPGRTSSSTCAMWIVSSPRISSTVV
jgi:hypothetical protein